MMSDQPKNDKQEKQENLEFKTWVIPLPNFRFEHEPYRRGKEAAQDFFGRDKEVEDFIAVLKNNSTPTGSYLVTGYRGAGKTSFIKKVLEHLTNGYPKLEDNKEHFRWLINIKNLITNKIPPTFHIRWLINIKNWISNKIPPAIFNEPLPKIIFIVIVLFYYLFILSYRLIDVFFLILLVGLFNFRKYGFAIFNPLQWISWVFKPVLQIHINLGYDIHEPKAVIFDIISLLRSRYRIFIRRTFLSKLIIPIFVLFISLLSSVIFYTSLPEFNKYLEGKLNSIIFIIGEEKSPSEVLESHCKFSKSHPYTLPYYYNLFNDKNIVKSDSENLSLLREFVIVVPYCAVYQFSKSVYAFSRLPHNPDNNFITINNSKERIAFGLRQIDNISQWVDIEREKLARNINENIEYSNEEIIKLAPRPYHLFLFILFILFFQSLRIWLPPHRRVMRLLDELQNRIEASDILDASGSPTSNFPFFWRKRYRYFQRLDARQAESELLHVLKENKKGCLLRPHIIFLFDELDKIHPPPETLHTGTLDAIELGVSESIRQRKFEIEKLLGSLKNLITAAPCHFIFAAGREMMDANLADRGEIRYLHGSLFDKIFYIGSFLTDESDHNHNDISSMVEQYVCRRLMKRMDAQMAYYSLNKNHSTSEDEYSYWSLTVYYKFLENQGVVQENRRRLIIFLQDFIYYLSYRSAGNVKKLSLLFEEFVHPTPKDIRNTEKYNVILDKEARNSLVLCFDEQEQYRIQLIGHFFMIFHGTYSRLIRQYGDKLSVSVFSILDYVCKFHSTGFSRRDLEHMPDALDIHRAPALPQITDILIDRILAPYTKKVKNGFFDFRFALYIQREILYISQFSEQDMAAFNFSLDESIQIKQHYRQLLNEQLNILQREMSDESNHISTQEKIDKYNVFAYLYAILGDLHSLDNEYDQAFIDYRNASSYANVLLERYNSNSDNYQNSDSNLKLSDYLTNSKEIGIPLIVYVRLMLKLGLLQERRMIFDSAAMIYSRAIEVIQHFTFKDNYTFSLFKINSEQLEVLFQPFLCLAFLHTKRDNTMETANNLMQAALDFIEKMQQENHQPFNDLEKNGFIYKHHIRWAEMWIVRSHFIKAQEHYAKALESFCQTHYSSLSKVDNGYLILSDLGMILAGLADSSAALWLNQYYSNNSVNYHRKSDSYDENNTIYAVLYEKLKNYLVSIKKSIDSTEYYTQEVFQLYILASYAYRLAGDLRDEELVLWKRAYLVAVGLSYSDFMQEKLKDFKKIFISNLHDFDWMFKDLHSKEPNNNPIRKISSQSFGRVYLIHQKHLRKDIGIEIKNDQDEDDKFIKWISPPLTQALMILDYFWKAYWAKERKEDKKMDNEAFQIVNMGTFPMLARIFALYLKGRWYNKYATQSFSKESEDYKQYKQIAFKCFVQAAKDISAYENGIDLTAPALGLVYYHIWELARENSINNKELLKDLHEDIFFKGDMQRYFSRHYCKNRAEVLLTELLSRHNVKGFSKDRYFNLAAKRYYLYDDFSDPFLQCVWAVEYGFIPVVRRMLDEIKTTPINS